MSDSPLRHRVAKYNNGKLTRPDHDCYRCGSWSWVYDFLMHNWRCNICYPGDTSGKWYVERPYK